VKSGSELPDNNNPDIAVVSQKWGVTMQAIVSQKHFTILIILAQMTFNCSAVACCQQAKLAASDANADDRFGVSVAIDGNIAVVGAYQSDSNGTDSGAAYVYELVGSQWIERQKITAPDGSAGDQFGRSVAIEGNTIVVGSYRDDNNEPATGSAYVFAHSGGVWSQQQKLTAFDASTGDRFGISVTISNDTIVVGAYGDDNYTGSAYVFVRTGPTWTFQQKLTASDANQLDHFGYSVAIDSNTIIVGAHNDDHSGKQYPGSAYVYERQGISWSQQAILRASDSSDADHFGCAVALDGNYAVIGAYECDINYILDVGAAYVFARTEAGWAQRQKLFDANDPCSGDDFGRSVAIKNDIIIAGCIYHSVNGRHCGAAFEFLRSGQTWSQRARLTAGDADANDNFGFSLALSVGRIIVGAHFADDNGESSGSAYIFADSFGDINGNCAVDFYDFAQLAAAWRTADGQLGYDSACDISIPPDNLIDFLDLKVLCDYWLAGK
jgi:hypothetical protein